MKKLQTIGEHTLVTLGSQTFAVPNANAADVINALSGAVSVSYKYVMTVYGDEKDRAFPGGETYYEMGPLKVKAQQGVPLHTEDDASMADEWNLMLQEKQKQAKEAKA